MTQLPPPDLDRGLALYGDLLLALVDAEGCEVGPGVPVAPQLERAGITRAALLEAATGLVAYGLADLTVWQLSSDDPAAPPKALWLDPTETAIELCAPEIERRAALDDDGDQEPLAA